jgi:5-methylcytosine-specific restriction protein A
MRNPPWTRDELILALDLYFQAHCQWLSPQNLEVIKLSAILNNLPIYSSEDRAGNFRNANGVSMKLGNFLNLDPQYAGKGLNAGSRLDQKIWDEFSTHPNYLHLVAKAIKDGAIELLASEHKTYIDASVDDYVFSEGQILTRVHLTRERNNKAIELKKQHTLEMTGRLCCEVCGFDFLEVYGELGRGFVECHHRLPLAQLNERHQTRMSNLAVDVPIAIECFTGANPY